jgi:hypothetical protein
LIPLSVRLPRQTPRAALELLTMFVSLPNPSVSFWFISAW